MKKPATILILVILTALSVNHFYGAMVHSATTKEVKSTGEALIGGPFSLLNHEGTAVTNENYQGKLMLVFFGFSHCPDICPTDLTIMTNALDELGEDADGVAPLFITVDPERDTPEVLAKYMENFSPRIQALTGTQAQIDAVTAAYRIFAKKIEMEGSMAGPMFNHSAYTYLMNKKGNYITHFPHNADAEAMATKIKEYL